MGTCVENGSDGEATRLGMQSYWVSHSKDASMEEMMLDSNAKKLSVEELPEVLSHLPDWKGKSVLELGAGIGRFTKIFGETAKSVVAVDFMESFINKNEEDNGHMKNISFQQADVTKLKMPKNSFDIIFSNWLWMYLEDEEIEALAQNMLEWLKKDGCLFFRESCFHQSGNASRDENPTKYRTPADYNKLFMSAIQQNAGGHYVYEIVRIKPLMAYIKHKNNPNQICWLMRKVYKASSESTSFREILDAKLYPKERLQLENSIISHDTATESHGSEDLASMLKLNSDHTVLDLGSGKGHLALLFTKEFELRVHGVDLSSNMVTLAMERACEMKNSKVFFELGDALDVSYSPETFDVIYSIDTIQHINDKRAILTSALTWLKPGGRLLIQDHCLSEKELSDNHREYIKEKALHLIKDEAYAKTIKEVGLDLLKVEDRTTQFAQQKRKHIAVLEARKGEILAKFSEKDFNALRQEWRDQLSWCEGKEQKCMLFLAQKPVRRD